MASSYCAIFLRSFVLIHIFHGKGFIRCATFTFVNKCPETVWPAILGSPSLDTTGFALPHGTSRSLWAPPGWSGRFWARTQCTFDPSSGRGSCITGDCGSGEVECGSSAASVATLAEFTLGSPGSMDFYDISLVDGFNLPMAVGPKGGSGPCHPTGCFEDVNRRCPPELRADGGGGACRSACGVFGTEEYCCSGAHGSPATCGPSVYSRLFKSVCPEAYSYAYDDATSTFTCSDADYVVTFCPELLSQNSTKPDNDTTTDGSADVSEPGPDPGAQTEPDGSGPAQETILADGSWLADLAIGGSTRTRSFGPVFIFRTMGIFLVVFVHIAAPFVPSQL